MGRTQNCNAIVKVMMNVICLVPDRSLCVGFGQLDIEIHKLILHNASHDFHELH